MNKRAIAPIVLIGIALALILVVYLILFIPIPAFTKVRFSVNYYLVVSLWIIIQIGVVYGGYKIISYLKQGLSIYKSKILRFDLRVKEFLFNH